MSTASNRSMPRCPRTVHCPRAVRCLATLMLAAGVAAQASADDSKVASSATIATVNGTVVYAHICQGCHMPAGLGAVGAGHYPKLAGDPALVSWQYVALTVLNGKNGMPAFGLPADEFVFGSVRLSDAQVADVVNYVRSHFGNTYKGLVTAAQVAALPHPGKAAP
ncbi:MAG TPA: cytochrome c [Steroidobacteraceae bacterium]|nr:cytochrome c [Steroidobacteraceae bacterium]